MTPNPLPSTQRQTLVALLVAAAFFMENLDGTIIATALPQMAESFASTPAALAVGMTSYLLTLAVFIPASGWVADRFGARPVFSAAIAGFTVASVLCAFSTSATTFTLARILQGAAGALMVPVGRLVVLRGTAPRDLLRAIATLTWPALVAPILGPPVGGFITHAYSWRWIFLINVPIGVVEFVVALILIQNGPAEQRRPFDRVGFVLNGLSGALLLAGLDYLGQSDADWPIAAAILATSAALGVAAVRHARRHAHPLVSLEAFGNASFRVAMAGGSIARITIGTMPFLLPLLFQIGLGMNAFASGLFVLWYGAANLAIKPFTSGILRRFGFRSVLIVNMVLVAATIAACAAITGGMPVVVTVLLLMLAGSSRSMMFTTLNTLTFADLPPALTGQANTLFNMAFQFSLALGIASGAILLRVTQAVLPDGNNGPAAAFHVVFFVVGAAGLLALPDFFRLDPDAGATASGRTRQRPPPQDSSDNPA